ncbi:MAG: exosortase-associated EpsI family protein [Gemmataceae bacterium]
MLRWLCSLTAACALLVTGIVHGYWSDRWSSDSQVDAAAALLTDIPQVIGDWEGEDMEVKPGQAGAGVAGCLQRTYRNRRLGTSVVVFLVNGRPGPVSIHTPEACYGASGFVVGKKDAVRLDKPEEAAKFWTSDAVRTQVAEVSRQRLYWAWNGGDGWKAAADARAEFPRGRCRVLHKLYVLRALTGSGPQQRDKDEPCVVFLNTLLPVLEQTLFRHAG